jgi:Cu-processing system permease protein
LAAGIPILLFVEINTALVMLLSGGFISSIFVSLAFLCSIVTRDKARGIGMAVMTWLYTTLLFDTLVLFLLFQYSDYPIESLVAGLTLTNPVDLSRILILLQLDTSALMGYTGAIFNQFIGNMAGMVAAIVILSLWLFTPFYISLRKFKRKDL